MPLPREEQETVIRIGYYDETCSICTTNPTHARHLEKRGLKPTQVSRIPVKWEEKVDRDGTKYRGKPIEWEDVAWHFEAPAEWFKLPKPPKQVSESQRRAAAERMRKLRSQDEEDDD